jgi:hypothetical protein
MKQVKPGVYSVTIADFDADGNLLLEIEGGPFDGQSIFAKLGQPVPQVNCGDFRFGHENKPHLCGTCGKPRWEHKS